MRPMTNAIRLDSMRVPKLAPKYERLSSDMNILRQTPHMIGIEAKKEYSADDSESRPTNLPVTIVVPDREAPGISASVCERPMTSARIGVR